MAHPFVLEDRPFGHEALSLAEAVRAALGVLSLVVVVHPFADSALGILPLAEEAVLLIAVVAGPSVEEDRPFVAEAHPFVEEVHPFAAEDHHFVVELLMAAFVVGDRPFVAEEAPMVVDRPSIVVLVPLVDLVVVAWIAVFHPLEE